MAQTNPDMGKTPNGDGRGRFADPLGLTPTQRRIYDLLRDGEPHTRDELMGCLGDDLTGTVTLRVHLFLLRRKLLARGLDVWWTPNGRQSRYRLTRPVTSDE